MNSPAKETGAGKTANLAGKGFERMTDRATAENMVNQASVGMREERHC